MILINISVGLKNMRQKVISKNVIRDTKIFPHFLPKFWLTTQFECCFYWLNLAYCKDLSSFFLWKQKDNGLTESFLAQ